MLIPKNRAVEVVLDRVVLLIRLDGFGETKVSNLHSVLALDEDVPCCQVPVHVLTGAQIVHALNEKKAFHARFNISVAVFSQHPLQMLPCSRGDSPGFCDRSSCLMALSRVLF